jgi:hypothetical protein
VREERTTTGIYCCGRPPPNNGQAAFDPHNQMGRPHLTRPIKWAGHVWPTTRETIYKRWEKTQMRSSPTKNKGKRKRKGKQKKEKTPQHRTGESSQSSLQSPTAGPENPPSPPYNLPRAGESIHPPQMLFMKNGC